VSAHALGNAIAIIGLDFGVATSALVLPDDLPSYLRGPFQVSVKRHFLRRGSLTQEAHARFLRIVTDRILEKRDVFRILIGPNHRGHADHFHFDMSPWRYVDL
jgi:hypothetical protein